MGEKIQKEKPEINPKQNPLKLNQGLFREHSTSFLTITSKRDTLIEVLKGV